MPSPFRHFLRQTGRDFAAESAGNEDLECGHRSLVPSNNTSSEYQSSLRGLHLPAIPSISGTLLPSGEDDSHVRYNSQHGSVAQLPLTPSGLSRVIGYLPRTTCDGSTPFVTPTGLEMPSQHSLSSSDGDWMGNSGPQCRSSPVPSLAFCRSPSPRPPFDPHKHGPALQRLEAHGSLKTVPSGQCNGSAFKRSSISYLGNQLEASEEGRAAKYRDPHPGQLAGQISAVTDETSNEQSLFDLSLPLGHFFAHNLNQPVVLNRENLSAIVDPPSAPDVEGAQVFREPLPSLAYSLPKSQADSSSQVAQQKSHSSQVSSKLHQTQHSDLNRGETVAAITLPNNQSKNPSFGRMFENDTTGRMSGSFSAEEREKQSFAKIPAQEHACQAPTSISSQIFEGMDEYLWSPAPSEDGQEALWLPHAPIPCHTPSEVSLSSPISGLASASNPDVYNSSLPQINVLIPAGKINLNSHTNFLSASQQVSTVGLGESSSMLCRYSGIVMDGASRPMSEFEFKEEIRNLPDNRPNFALSMRSSMESIHSMSQVTTSKQIRREHEPNAGSKALALDRVQNPSADAGPGSSQTSSSISTHRYGGDLSGHKVRSEFHMLPTSRARCHTPPLLFGKSAIRGPEMSNATSTLVPKSTIARFSQNVTAVRLNKRVGLPMAVNSLIEQDWETISADTEAHTYHFSNIACNTNTSSSLADNSDSGNLSLSEEMHHPFCSMNSHPVMQHPAHPRHNYSFVLLKNSQTGDFVQVPQYGHASGGCLPNNNVSSQLVSSISAEKNYQHPSPLQAEHTHPLASSPPIIRFRELSAFNNENDCVLVQHSDLSADSSSLGVSEGFQRVKEFQTQDLSYKTEDVSRIPRVAANQKQQKMGFREQSCQSSAWLSTVSKVMSSELSFPGNEDPLTKMTVQNSSKHVDSTSEQETNLDLESSLAEIRSQGSNLSRSSEQMMSSPIRFPDISLSSRRKLHEQAIRQNLEIGSQRRLAYLQKSLAKPSSRDISATLNTKGRYRSHSAFGLRPEHYKALERQRRSSCESYSRLMDSPSAQRASATNLLPTDCDAQQTTCSKTLLRDPFLDLGDNDSRYHNDQKNLIERRSRQAEVDDASIDNPNTPSTVESQPFVQRGVVHTDARIPIFDNPIHGHERPWVRFKPCPLRQRPHPKPLGPHLFQRPIARAESPHLHHVPHPTTTELLERHVLLSRIYLIASMVVPPIALVYGHGYMDSLMRLHTAGQINGFRTTEKTIALCWVYGVSATCIFAIIIVITIIPASA